jgi:hypothetical protein
MSAELEKKKKVTNTTVSKVIITNLAIFSNQIFSACGWRAQPAPKHRGPIKSP